MPMPRSDTPDVPGAKEFWNFSSNDPELFCGKRRSSSPTVSAPERLISSRSIRTIGDGPSNSTVGMLEPVMTTGVNSPSSSWATAGMVASGRPKLMRATVFTAFLILLVFALYARFITIKLLLGLYYYCLVAQNIGNDAVCTHSFAGQNQHPFSRCQASDSPFL